MTPKFQLTSNEKSPAVSPKLNTSNQLSKTRSVSKSLS